MAEDYETVCPDRRIRGRALEESFHNSAVGELAFRQTCEYHVSSLPRLGTIQPAETVNTRCIASEFKLISVITGWISAVTLTENSCE